MRVAIFALLGLLALSCTNTPKEEAVPPSDPNLAPAVIKNGLPMFRIRDLKLGSGNEAKNGMRMQVHYTAWLFDPEASEGRGKEFETTLGKEPYEFQLGRGDLLPGWEQGFYGFREGGKRELTIPPSMAYGDKGFPGKVPAKTALIYEIELLAVKPPVIEKKARKSK